MNASNENNIYDHSFRELIEECNLNFTVTVNNAQIEHHTGVKHKNTHTPSTTQSPLTKVLPTPSLP